MDIVNIKVTFVDTFNQSTTVRHVTRSKETFELMKKDIGKVFDHFDKKQQIHYTLKVVNVEQAN